jgi:pSer/pThr/pTyr-binding forkhead associated (FHA) protein
MATYQLFMNKGPTPGKVYDLTGSVITLGRDLNADIVINIPDVSRRHAQFRLEAGVFMLEDVGSTNGTFVNGQRLSSPQRLRNRDTIMLGEAISLVFSGGASDPNATVVAPSNQAATMVAKDTLDLPPLAPANIYMDDPLAVPPPPPLATPPFLGTVPAGSMDYGSDMPLDKSKNRTWLWAGLGCVAVIVIGCIAGALLFDMMDMYCQPPFESLFSFLYDC